MAGTLDNLGIDARDKGDRAAARLFFERALAILTSTYGPRHRHTILVRTNLESVLDSVVPSK